MRAEHDHPVPLEPLHPVHGRERHLAGGARVVAHGDALQVLAQPGLERRRDRDAPPRSARSAVTSSRCDASRPRPELSSVPIAAPSPTSSRTERSTVAASLDATITAEAVEVVGERRAGDRCRRCRARRRAPAGSRASSAAVADRVDDPRGDPPVRAARDLGQVGAAQLAAVGDRSRRGAGRPSALRTPVRRRNCSPTAAVTGRPRSCASTCTASSPALTRHSTAMASGAMPVGQPLVDQVGRVAARSPPRSSGVITSGSRDLRHRLRPGAHRPCRRGAGCARAACGPPSTTGGGQR